MAAAYVGKIRRQGGMPYHSLFPAVNKTLMYKPYSRHNGNVAAA
jgi:hypothetical protein